MGLIHEKVTDHLHRKGTHENPLQCAYVIY